MEDGDPQDGTRNRTLRTFGRALHLFGSGAKAVFAHPVKAARRGRSKQQPPGAQASQAVDVPNMIATQHAVTIHPFEMMRNEMVDGFQHTQQVLTGHLQGSAEFLRQRLTSSIPGSGGFLSASCFPAKIAKQKSSKSSLTSSEEGQDLVCSGSRNLLRIRLYDFAVYLDRKEVQQSKARKQFEEKESKQARGAPSSLKLAKQVRDSTDIEMSLLVRASRNLPILLLSKEYERILRRRLRVVGGNPQDPALNAMMDTFREESLPADIRHGGSVKKGTVLSFTRDHEGNITAKANHHDLISVKSQKLAQAVFDIYLGDQVVCSKARDNTVSSFRSMLGTKPYQPPASDLLCNESVCRIGRL